MKLTKADLKSVVKECLIEILNEGLSMSPSQNRNIPQKTSSFPFSESARKQVAQKQRVATNHLSEAIKKEAGGNKIMEMILADTAASTLPKMLDGDRKGHYPSQPGGIAEQVVAAAEPEELFGEEVASKWADLAFMGSPLKK